MTCAGTLILFAKYPTPGKVKTRLIPAVDAETAALLAEAFLQDVADRVARTFDVNAACVLCFDPPDARGAFSELLANVPVFLERFEFVEQRGAGLGERLALALNDIRRTSGGPYIFIGTDTPDLPVSEIEKAATVARTGSAFLSRAHDGGYVLLALPENAPLNVFDNIAWSSTYTARDQIDQLKRCGIETVVSERVWRDVDEPDDLMALVARLNADTSLALRTQIVIRACLD
ncbi:MAG: TIGR04282 family arsenosugar biosynthesis glycosyltransferase [Planctomycetota bacterium]